MPKSNALPETFHSAGVPEELFIVNPKAPKEIDTDTLTCAIKRARAVLGLISANGDEEDYFRLTHDTIITGLWALEGMLKQIEQMVSYSIHGGKS